MKRSTDRILVTHVGSLARPKDLMEMLVARNEGKDYDSAALARRTREAVSEVVQKQIDCGIDIVNDGELGKSNFSRYARERLSGFVERDADPNSITDVFSPAIWSSSTTISIAAPHRYRASCQRVFFASRRSSMSATRC